MRSQSWDGSARAHLLSVKMPVSFAVILVITTYYHASMQTGEKKTKKVATGPKTKKAKVVEDVARVVSVI